ncbi:IS66 family insertion sequence element accessory protein TnpB [Alkaliphilus hydrothermalis]|uniref:Transposase n=1 Tax=Alkaliphilus hydrothermalis TaxID=1482730 RepID=A0ABS2NQB5_9FIRM|nr:IS66 family insertion sequence element accessory protein TnpB [Alkaliphilus hydrothermalis]MBM7615155.1 transposase [Alkaliphilus hydrothermalis]
MLAEFDGFIRVYVACGHTDMRKSIDGLSAIVAQNFKLDPFDKSLFLFCGRRRDRLKGLLWEGDGFLLLYKRLEGGKFNWPKDPREVMELTPQQYRWLVEGLSIHQKKIIPKLDKKRLI